MEKIKITGIIFAFMFCVSCSSNIGSYEEGIQAQQEVMEKMINVLESVNDDASAKSAAGKIEELSTRMLEIATQIAKLPKPNAKEMQEIAKKMGKQKRELSQKAATQMMKLAKYKPLGEAWTNAMKNMK